MIVRDAARHALMQGCYIVDALANVDTRAKQILIYIRHGPTIDIYGRIPTIKMCEVRAFAQLGQNLDPRLQDGMTGNDPTAFVVNDRLVQRMRQNSDKAHRRFWR